MTDRPIIFSAPMVRALLDARKTQTRRLATSPLRRCEAGARLWVRESFAAEELSRPPKTVPATSRERRLSGRTTSIVIDDLDGADGVRYLADDAWLPIASTPEAGEAWFEAFHYGFKNGSRPSGYRGKGIPSIHMRRWASRLTLIVEAVRVEPLQSISNEDCIAEGVPIHPNRHAPRTGPIQDETARRCGLISHYGAEYRRLWSSLHTKDGQRWDDNPDVLVLTFRVMRGNIDQVTG
jgi:hypothetical protein